MVGGRQDGGVPETDRLQSARKCFQFSAAIPNFRYIARADFPSWSPTGDRFVVAIEPGLQISSTPRARMAAPFTTAKARRWRSRAWSPDGKAIAFGFGSYFTGHAKPAAVAMVNADGTGFRRVTDGPGNAGFPSWSPDGKRIEIYRVAGSEQGLRF